MVVFFADLASFVQQVKNPELALNEVDTRLVVMETDKRPLYGFPYILLLLQLEDVLVWKGLKMKITFAKELEIEGLTRLNCCCSFSLA